VRLLKQSHNEGMLCNRILSAQRNLLPACGFVHRSGIAEGSIAEREVVLTYALDLLHVSGQLARFAFKGGTCIRKVYQKSTGRFSMELTRVRCSAVRLRYSLLRDLTAEESLLAADAMARRERRLWQRLVESSGQMRRGGAPR